MEERLRLEDACRDALKSAYDMMIKGGWSQFKAYDYAYDLLEGMSRCLFAMKLYDELAVVRYYKTIANNKMYRAQEKSHRAGHSPRPHIKEGRKKYGNNQYESEGGI